MVAARSILNLVSYLAPIIDQCRTDAGWREEGEKWDENIGGHTGGYHLGTEEP